MQIFSFLQKSKINKIKQKLKDKFRHFLSKKIKTFQWELNKFRKRNSLEIQLIRKYKKKKKNIKKHSLYSSKNHVIIK